MNYLVLHWRCQLAFEAACAAVNVYFLLSCLNNDFEAACAAVNEPDLLDECDLYFEAACAAVNPYG